MLSKWALRCLAGSSPAPSAMKIIVLSRGEAVEFRNDTPWAVVSIRNPEDSPPLLGGCPNMRDVLWMTFDDIDRILPGTTAFDMQMAKEVWDFVENLEVDTLVCHCIMGQSRSPGVAAAISRVKHGDDQDIFKTTTPNMRVYRAMLNEAHRRGLIDRPTPEQLALWGSGKRG